MKIINLGIENIKKIKAIDISPDKNTIMITGGNEQGKSTVLDSIFMALTGQISEDPISHGKEKGIITVDMGEYVVKRILTKKSNRLELRDKDGSTPKAPQKILNGLFGNISFDPLEFGKLNAKEQKDTLLRLIGVDLDMYEKEEKEIYEERTVINREIKTLEGKLKNYTDDYTEVADEEIKIVDLIAEIKVEKDKEERSDEIIGIVTSREMTNDNHKEQIEIYEKQISACRIDIEKNTKEIIEVEKEKDAIEFNYTELEIQLSKIDETNSVIRDKQTKDLLTAELIEKTKESNDKTDMILKTQSTKKHLLDNADMPINGLSVTDEGVVFDGSAFSELSTAQSLKVSLAIAMKMNPKLKVILVKSGNDLDPSNLKIIQEMVDAEDYQLWIEKVDTSGEIGLYIEEGEIIEPEEDEY